MFQTVLKYEKVPPFVQQRFAHQCFLNFVLTYFSEMKKTFQLSNIVKIKIQFSAFLWFLCVLRSLLVTPLYIASRVGLNYLTFLLGCHCLKSNVLTLPFFSFGTFLKGVPESISISLYRWETDTKLNEKNDYPVLILHFWRESVTNDANNCLHSSLNCVSIHEYIGVEFQTLTFNVSNILGYVCNLQNSKLCCSAEVVSFTYIHTFVCNSELAFMKKDNAFLLSSFEGRSWAKCYKSKAFLIHRRWRACWEDQYSLKNNLHWLTCLAAAWVAELVLLLLLCTIFTSSTQVMWILNNEVTF